MAKFSRTLKVGVLCMLWYICSSANNVIGKRILNKYPYPLTLTLFHMIANAFLMYPILMMAGLRAHYHISRQFLLRFVIPLGLGKLLASIASHVSIWRVSVSYAHTIKSSLPIFTVVLSKVIYKEHHSWLVYVSLMPIVLGVGIATMTEVSFELYGMFSALFATFVFSVQNLYSKLGLKEMHLNPLQMLVKISQVALMVAVPLWIFVDSPVMSHDVNLSSTTEKFDYFTTLSLSGFINFLQNVTAFSVLHLLSALSYSVANATKRVLVIIVSLLMLRNPVTMVNFCGMMLAVLGVFLYNRAKMYQNSKGTVLPMTNENARYVSTRYQAFNRMFASYV